MNVEKLAESFKFSIEQMIRVCKKNDINVENASDIISAENLEKIIYFLENTSMVTVEMFAENSELTNEQVLDFCEKIDIDVDSKDDLLFEDDINDLVEYIQEEMSKSSSSSSSQEKLLKDNGDLFDHFTSLDELEDFTGFLFEYEDAIVAQQSLSPITSMLSSVSSALKGAEFLKSECASFSRAGWYLGVINSFFNSFSIKFSTFLNYMNENYEGFETIFTADIMGNGELADKYLDECLRGELDADELARLESEFDSFETDYAFCIANELDYDEVKSVLHDPDSEYSQKYETFLIQLDAAREALALQYACERDESLKSVSDEYNLRSPLNVGKDDIRVVNAESSYDINADYQAKINAIDDMSAFELMEYVAYFYTTSNIDFCVTVQSRSSMSNWFNMHGIYNPGYKTIQEFEEKDPNGYAEFKKEFGVFKYLEETKQIYNEEIFESTETYFPYEEWYLLDEIKIYSYKYPLLNNPKILSAIRDPNKLRDMYNLGPNAPGMTPELWEFITIFADTNSELYEVFIDQESNFQKFMNCNSYGDVERKTPDFFNYILENRTKITGSTPLSLMCYLQRDSYSDWEYCTKSEIEDAMCSPETSEQEKEELSQLLMEIEYWEALADPSIVAKLGRAYGSIEELETSSKDISVNLSQLYDEINHPIDVPSLITFFPDVLADYEKYCDEHGISPNADDAFAFNEFWMSYSIGYVIYDENGVPIQIITEAQAKANPELIEKEYNGNFAEPATLGDLYVYGENSFKESVEYNNIIAGMANDPNFFDNWEKSSVYNNCVNSDFYSLFNNAILYNELGEDREVINAILDDTKVENIKTGDEEDYVTYSYKKGTLHDVAASYYMYDVGAYILSHIDDPQFKFTLNSSEVLDELYNKCINIEENFSEDLYGVGARAGEVNYLQTNDYMDPNAVCADLNGYDYQLILNDPDVKNAILLKIMRGDFVDASKIYERGSEHDDDEYILVFNPKTRTVSLVFDGYYGKKIDLYADDLFYDGLCWFGDRYLENGLEVVSESDRTLLTALMSLPSNPLIPSSYTMMALNKEQYDSRWVASQKNRDTVYATSHWANALDASLHSVMFGWVEGVNAMISSYAAKKNGEPIDIKSVYSRSDTYRSAVSNWIEETHPRKILGYGWSDIYNTTMSVLDTAPLMALNFILPGGGSVLSQTLSGIIKIAASSVFMGSRAYVSTLNDALSRGVSDEDAIRLATSACLAETVMEYISAGSLANLAFGENALVNAIVNKLPLSWQKWSYKILSALYQAVEESVEEGQTEVFNMVADYYISGELSNFQLILDEKMDKNPNLTYDEAFDLTMKDLGSQVFEALKGGFLSGLFFGGVGSLNINTNEAIINAMDNTFNEFNDSTYNADLKKVRSYIRNGQYLDAMNYILYNDNLNQAQKTLASMRLYDNLLKYNVDNIEGLSSYVNANIKGFSDLNLNDKIEQFKKLDLNSQIVLFSSLGQNGISLFNGLDLNAKKTLFSSLSLNDKLSILTKIDVKTMDILLPNGKDLADFIIDNQAYIVDFSRDLNMQEINSCKDNLKAILDYAGLKFSNIDTLLNEMINDSDAFDKFNDEVSSKLPSDILSNFIDTMSTLKKLVVNMDEINKRSTLLFSSNNYKNDSERNQAKYKIASMIYPEAELCLFNIFNAKTSIENASVSNDFDFVKEQYFAVAEILNSNAAVDVLAKYEGDADYDAIIGIVDDINARLENLERTVANKMIGDAKKNAAIKALKKYCDLFGLKISETELSSFIEIDSDGNIPSRNISELGKFLESKTDFYTRDIVADLYEFIQSPMYEQSTRVYESAIRDSVKLACTDLRNQIILTLSSDTIIDVDGYLDALFATDLKVDPFNVAQLEVNEAVADVLSQKDTMEALDKYKDDSNYAVIEEKVNDILKAQEDAFNAKLEVEIDAAIREETIHQIKQHCIDNGYTIKDSRIEECVGLDGTVNIPLLSDYISRSSDKSVKDISISLKTHINSNEFIDSIRTVEEAVYEDVKHESDKILDSLITDLLDNNSTVGNEISVSNSDIDTNNAETSGKDHFDNVSGIVPIALKSDTDDMGDNRTDKKLNEKDNKTNNNSSEEITQDDNKKDDKKDNKNETINDKKKQFMAGIEAMDNKSGDAGVGLRAIYDYLVNGNIKGITTVAKFRQFIRGMDIVTLIKFYNEMAIDYNSNNIHNQLLLVSNNSVYDKSNVSIVKNSLTLLNSNFIEVYNSCITLLERISMDKNLIPYKAIQNRIDTLKSLISDLSNVVKNLMVYQDASITIDDSADSYDTNIVLLNECMQNIKSLSNYISSLGKAVKGRLPKVPKYMVNIFSNMEVLLKDSLDEINNLNQVVNKGDVDKSTVINKQRFMSGIEVMDNKAGDVGVGIRAIYDYLVNGNIKGITVSDKFRQFIRSMDTSLLVEWYNEYVLDYNETYADSKLLLIEDGDIFNNSENAGGNIILNNLLRLYNLLTDIKLKDSNILKNLGDVIKNFISDKFSSISIDAFADSFDIGKAKFIELRNVFKSIVDQISKFGNSVKSFEIISLIDSLLEKGNILFNNDSVTEVAVGANITVSDTFIPKQYNSMEDVMGEVSKNNQFNKNFKGLMSSALKFLVNGKSKFYDFLVCYDVSKKNVPSKESQKLILSEDIISGKEFFGSVNDENGNVKYVSILNDSYWVYLQGGNYNDSSTRHRLYINADYDVAYKFLDIFCLKCKELGLPFKLKTSYFGDGKDISSKLSRAESGVIYCSDEHLVQYINICNEIRSQHPEFKFYSPPAVTSSIDGWLGYGAEPQKISGVEKSFHAVRAVVLQNAITKVVNNFISKNANVEVTDGKTVDDLLFKNLYQRVSATEFIENLSKEQRVKLLNYVKENRSDLLSQIHNKGKVEITFNGETISFNTSVIKSFVYYDLFKDSEIFYQQVYDALCTESVAYGVDLDNFATDNYDNKDSSRFKSFEEFIGGKVDASKVDTGNNSEEVSSSVDIVLSSDVDSNVDGNIEDSKSKDNSNAISNKLDSLSDSDLDGYLKQLSKKSIDYLVRFIENGNFSDTDLIRIFDKLSDKKIKTLEANLDIGLKKRIFDLTGKMDVSNVDVEVTESFKTKILDTLKMFFKDSLSSEVYDKISRSICFYTEEGFLLHNGKKNANSALYLTNNSIMFNLSSLVVNGTRGIDLNFEMLTQVIQILLNEVSGTQNAIFENRSGVKSAIIQYLSECMLCIDSNSKISQLVDKGIISIDDLISVCLDTDVKVDSRLQSQDLSNLSDSELRECLSNLGIGKLLLTFIEGRSFNDADLVRVFNNLSELQIMQLEMCLDLGMQYEIHEKTGFLQSNYLVEIGINFIRTEFVPVLKFLFPMITDTKINELLGRIKFFTNERANLENITDCIGGSDGTNIFINVDVLNNDTFINKGLKMIDCIIHESIHYISASSTSHGFWAKSRKMYLGINEAVTQYLTEIAMGDSAYVKYYYDPSQHYLSSGYDYPALKIRELVDMGVLNLNDLVNAYINGDYKYLENTLMKYLDDVKQYHSFLDCMTEIAEGKDLNKRVELDRQLDDFILLIKAKYDSTTDVTERFKNIDFNTTSLSTLVDNISRLDVEQRKQVLSDSKVVDVFRNHLLNGPRTHDFYNSIFSKIDFIEMMDVFDADFISQLFASGRPTIDYTFFASLFINAANSNQLLDVVLNNNVLFDAFKERYKYMFSCVNVDTEHLMDLIIKIEETDSFDYFRSLNFDKEQGIGLLKEEFSPKTLFWVLSNSNIDLISDFYQNDSRAELTLPYLKDKIYLFLKRGVKFGNSIIKNPAFFEMIKRDNLVEFRQIINLLEDECGDPEFIETKRKQYYNEQMDLCLEQRKIFAEYDRILSASNLDVDVELQKINSPLSSEKLFYRYKMSRDIMLEENNRRISDLIVDDLFQDNLYNVWINIVELIRYDEHLIDAEKILTQERMDFYKSILQIDSYSVEERIALYNKYKDQNINLSFYEDIRASKDHAYERIREKLIKIDAHPEFISKEETEKNGVVTYDLREQEFYMMIRVIGAIYSDAGFSGGGSSYSLISNNNSDFFHHGGIIYGYNSFDIDKVEHLFEEDSFTDMGSSFRNKTLNATERVSRIATIEEIVDDTFGYSELFLRNDEINNDGTTDRRLFREIRPDFIVVVDNVDQRSIDASKKLNLPIVMIKSNSDSGARDYIDTYKEYAFDSNKEEQRITERDNYRKSLEERNKGQASIGEVEDATSSFDNESGNDKRFVAKTISPNGVNNTEQSDSGKGLNYYAEQISDGNNHDIDSGNVETSGTDHFDNVSGIVPIGFKSDTDDMGDKGIDNNKEQKNDKGDSDNITDNNNQDNKDELNVSADELVHNKDLMEKLLDIENNRDIFGDYSRTEYIERLCKYLYGIDNVNNLSDEQLINLILSEKNGSIVSLLMTLKDDISFSVKLLESAKTVEQIEMIFDNIDADDLVGITIYYIKNGKYNKLSNIIRKIQDVKVLKNIFFVFMNKFNSNAVGSLLSLLNDNRFNSFLFDLSIDELNGILPSYIKGYNEFIELSNKLGVEVTKEIIIEFVNNPNDGKIMLLDKKYSSLDISNVDNIKLLIDDINSIDGLVNIIDKVPSLSVIYSDLKLRLSVFEGLVADKKFMFDQQLYSVFYYRSSNTNWKLFNEVMMLLDGDSFVSFVRSYDTETLLKLITSKNLTGKVMRDFLTHISYEQYTYLLNNIEFSLRREIALYAGLESFASSYVDSFMYFYEKAMEYIKNEYLLEMKALFKNFVSEEKFEELLKTHLFKRVNEFIETYGSENAMGVMANNNGIVCKYNTDYFYKLDDDKENVSRLLFDTVVHESIHHISAGTGRSGFRYKTDDGEVYRGINEACTEYFAQLVRKGKSYQQVTSKAESGYYYTVQELSRLVDNGIFDLNELIENYIKGNTGYLYDTLSKYVDDKAYNRIIKCFFDVNESKDNSVRKSSLIELQDFVSDIIGLANSGETGRKLTYSGSSSVSPTDIVSNNSSASRGLNHYAEQIIDGNKFEEVNKFLRYDMKVKEILVKCSAVGDNIGTVEMTAAEYSDLLYSSLGDLEFYLIKMCNLYPKFNGDIKYIKQLFSDYKKQLAKNSKDITKLKNFYQTYFSNLSTEVIELVGRNCVGYSYKGVALSEAKTINELLHIMHQTLLNDHNAYESVPVLDSKRINDYNSINLRGKDSEVVRKIFDSCPENIDIGDMDILSLSDTHLIIMVRDRGHALTIEVEVDGDTSLVRYFIPKICNAVKVNQVKGVRKVSLNSKVSDYTNGKFEVKTEDISTEIYDLILSIPTDFDIDFSQFGFGLNHYAEQILDGDKHDVDSSSLSSLLDESDYGLDFYDDSMFHDDSSLEDRSDNEIPRGYKYLFNGYEDVIVRDESLFTDKPLSTVANLEYVESGDNIGVELKKVDQDMVEEVVVNNDYIAKLDEIVNIGSVNFDDLMIFLKNKDITIFPEKIQQLLLEIGYEKIQHYVIDKLYHKVRSNSLSLDGGSKAVSENGKFICIISSNQTIILSVSDDANDVNVLTGKSIYIRDLYYLLYGEFCDDNEDVIEQLVLKGNIVFDFDFSVHYSKFHLPSKITSRQFKRLNDFNSTELKSYMQQLLFDSEDVISHTLVQGEFSIDLEEYIVEEFTFGTELSISNKNLTMIYDQIVDDSVKETNELNLNLNELKIRDVDVVNARDYIIDFSKLSDKFKNKFLEKINYGKSQIEKVNGYVFFDLVNSMQQLIDYFGESTSKVRNMLLEGYSIDEIKANLSADELNEFENFLNNTSVGRFIVSIDGKILLPYLIEYVEGGDNSHIKINDPLYKAGINGIDLNSIPDTLVVSSGMKVKDIISGLDLLIESFGGLKENMILYKWVGSSTFDSQVDTIVYKEMFRGLSEYNVDPNVQAYLIYKRFREQLNIRGSLPYFSGGFISTSPKFNLEDWMDKTNIVLQFLVPAGTPGAYVNQFSHKFYNKEYELLLGRGLKGQIIDVALIKCGDKYNVMLKCVLL